MRKAGTHTPCTLDLSPRKRVLAAAYGSRLCARFAAWAGTTPMRTVFFHDPDGTPPLLSRQRLRSQNANETASTAVRPNQVIAYCR